ncbi:MAG: pimeloyl-ACP methyl ester carboxylesterase [Paraglaciecola sp.]
MSEEKSKAILHFAHANGFPASSYNKVFSTLQEDYHVIAVNKFGHTSRFPISQNWTNQVSELIEYIENTSSEPVFAVGHSFGGVISYMAACTRPELFRGLIMLDPPVVTGLSRLLFKMCKYTPLIDKLTPAGKTIKRCNRWDKNTDIVTYFKVRALFKNMDPDCIQDYVDGVMELQGNDYSLNFKPEVEANIFRNVPHNINRFYGQLQCPALLVTGQHTTVCTPKLIAPFIRGNKLEHQIMAGGGHMFVLEKPKETARLIAHTLARWQQL